jgi:hypothetical protein
MAISRAPGQGTFANLKTVCQGFHLLTAKGADLCVLGVSLYNRMIVHAFCVSVVILIVVASLKSGFRDRPKWSNINGPRPSKVATFPVLHFLLRRVYIKTGRRSMVMVP